MDSELIGKVNGMKPAELGKFFIETLREKEALEQQLTEMNKKISFMDSALYSKLEEYDVEEIKVDEIKLERKEEEQFGMEDKYKDEKGAANWDDEDGVFYKWLDEIGESGLIKTKMSVHSKTRNSFLKNIREDGKNLPDFIKISFWKHIKYNKSAIKRQVNEV